MRNGQQWYLLGRYSGQHGHFASIEPRCQASDVMDIVDDDTALLIVDVANKR